MLGLNDAVLAHPPADRRLRTIADAHGATLGQIVLAWLIQLYRDT